MALAPPFHVQDFGTSRRKIWLIAEATEKWAKVVKFAGIKAD
jgi:hypothetical protein